MTSRSDNLSGTGNGLQIQVVQDRETRIEEGGAHRTWGDQDTENPSEDGQVKGWKQKVRQPQT